jgi:hypothetical protein
MSIVDLDEPQQGLLALARTLNLRDRRGELDRQKAGRIARSGIVPVWRPSPKVIVHIPSQVLATVKAGASNQPTEIESAA